MPALVCAALLAALAPQTRAVIPVQFTISATDIAPATAQSGHSTAVLRVKIGNPIAGGIANIRLHHLGLRVEGGSGLSLNAQQAAALVSDVEIYKDTNGSESYEPAVDALVTNVGIPAFTPDGALTVSFQDADPQDLLVSSGQLHTYFVAVRLAVNAATANPNSFRVSHLANGAYASGVLDASTGIALTTAPTTDVASSIITANANHAPTTTGLADIVVFDTGATSMVPLFPAFHGVPDVPQQLSYAVIGNTNPSLFQFVGIDPSSGILSIQYAGGTSGTARLTVRATDSAGNSVATDFTVTVIPLVEFGDFAQYHAGANGGNPPGPLDFTLGNGLSNLLNYAFFLNDGAAGGVAGLPRMEGTGQSHIFTHLRPKYASDLLYHYEISQDLVTWAPAAKDVDYYQHTTDLGNGSVRVELLLLVNWSKAFMRVRTELFDGPAPVAPPPLSEGVSSGTAAITPPSSAGSGQSIQGTVLFSEDTVLDDSQLYASGVAVADFDLDGFMDVAAASQNDDTVAWYHNNGDGTFGPKQSLTNTADGAIAVAAGDLDQDGRPDIVAVSEIDSKITVIRHDATGAFMPPQVVSNAVRFPTSVSLGDLNGDGKPDIVTNSFLDWKIAWCRNLGNGAFAPAQVLTYESRAPWVVTTADLDGDGALDILIGAVNDHAISWCKGNGNGTFGPKRDIATGVNTPASVCACDLDGDGRLDVLAALAADNRIVWCRNLGGGVFGPMTLISDRVVAPYFVHAADLNGDGRLEVLSASVNDSKLAWYRNRGGGNFGNPAENQTIIPSNLISPFSIATADFNRDGVIDVASASQDDSTIAVHFNYGGQTAFATTNTAPATAVNGQRRDVLRIVACNRGVTGDADARLASVALLFESSPGVPLSRSAANRLIENLYIYADANASGAFEPFIDVVVGAIPYLPLADGKLAVPVQSGTPNAVIPPGQSRNFFVVPQWSITASTQTPGSFRVTHLGSGLDHSVLTSASSGNELTVESLGAANISSSFVTAVTNTPPTSLGLPAVTVHDTVAPTFIAASSYFNDAEDGPAGLRYSIADNSNPGLFAFAAIDPTTGLLGLGYRPGKSGSAVVTVRATDSVGASTYVTCTVNVILADTFANWLSSYGSPNGANLLKYAFALNPLAGGDTAGLPHARTQGKNLVVTHLKQRWATDLTYQYEISQDLVNWIPAVRDVHFHEFMTNLPNGVRQSDLILLVNWPRAFMRVRALLPN